MIRQAATAAVIAFLALGLLVLAPAVASAGRVTPTKPALTGTPVQGGRHWCGALVKVPGKPGLMRCSYKRTR